MQTLILRHNKLISTEGIEILVSLRQLDLGHNMLSSIDPEIVRLKSLQSLTALTLEGNPIALLDQYRSHLCAALGRTEDQQSSSRRKHNTVNDLTRPPLVLDGRPLTKSELNRGKRHAHQYTEMTQSPTNVLLRGDVRRRTNNNK